MVVRIHWILYSHNSSEYMQVIPHRHSSPWCWQCQEGRIKLHIYIHNYTHWKYLWYKNIYQLSRNAHIYSYLATSHCKKCHISKLVTPKDGAIKVHFQEVAPLVLWPLFTWSTRSTRPCVVDSKLKISVRLSNLILSSVFLASVAKVSLLFISLW